MARSYLLWESSRLKRSRSPLYFLWLPFYPETPVSLPWLKQLSSQRCMWVFLCFPETWEARSFFSRLTLLWFMYPPDGRDILLLGWPEEQALLLSPIFFLVMFVREYQPGRIPWLFMRMRDIRSCSPFSPSEQGDGSVWDSARDLPNPSL